MKRKNGFIIREVADSWVVVAIGEESKYFNGMVKMNETSAFLFQALEKEMTKEELVYALMEAYEVDEEKASEDVSKFCQILLKAGILQE